MHYEDAQALGRGGTVVHTHLLKFEHLPYLLIFNNLDAFQNNAVTPARTKRDSVVASLMEIQLNRHNIVISSPMIQRRDINSRAIVDRHPRFGVAGRWDAVVKLHPLQPPKPGHIPKSHHTIPIELVHAPLTNAVLALCDRRTAFERGMLSFVPALYAGDLHFARCDVDFPLRVVLQCQLLPAGVDADGKPHVIAVRAAFGVPGVAHVDVGCLLAAGDGELEGVLAVVCLLCFGSDACLRVVSHRQVRPMRTRICLPAGPFHEPPTSLSVQKTWLGFERQPVFPETIR
jgi:hypothetical protein